jgi:hypothetical protein
VLQVQEREKATVEWGGGWEALAPRSSPTIGDRSAALRITSERMEGGRYHLTVQGRAGQTYSVRVRGPEGGADAPVQVLPAGAGVPRLQPSAPDSLGWRALRVAFPTTGADDDGYVTLTLVM